jgi:catechol 2,3-dioxygenase
MQSFGIAPPGYRLPEGTRVGAIRLQVSDLARSLRFYETVLGFRVLSKEGRVSSLGNQGEGTPLLWLHDGDDIRPSTGGRLGLYHFAILLPDRPSLARFSVHLAAQRLRTGMADHLVSEAIYLSDPDHLGIEVYSDRPRESWNSEGRELVMATEPLDVPGLVKDAGDRSWDGLPTGTSIGHIHLHVGDLRDAERFYHSSLGFDKVVWSYPGALFFSAGGYHHHVGTNVWGSGRAADENEARLLSWQLHLPDNNALEGAAQSLRSAGFTAQRSDGGWTTEDPWGTRVELQ